MAKQITNRSIIAFLLCLFLIAAIACSIGRNSTEYPDNPISQRETLVQVSTIDALLNGVYDGVITFDVLRKYGDFGIGTFEGLDGEMLGFDGKFYQVKADGNAYPVTDQMKTPFASVTFFDADSEEQLPEGIDYKQMEKFLDDVLPTPNIFYAIKIEGTFSQMKTRSVPVQKKPYPPLAEVTKNQPVFELGDVKGTLVGFRCPAYITGINVPGYHLHFLTQDEKGGGHVLDFKLKKASAALDYTLSFLMLLPDKKSDFYKINLNQERQADLEKVEK